MATQKAFVRDILWTLFGYHLYLIRLFSRHFDDPIDFWEKSIKNNSARAEDILK